MAQSEIQSRIIQVAEWLLEGQSRNDIAEALLADECKNDASGLISEAYQYLARIANAESERVAFHLEARRELYRQCKEINDFRTAHSILQDIAKIEGIYEGKKQTKRFANDASCVK